MTSKSGLLAEVAQLKAKVMELGARRKANQRKLSDVNLEVRCLHVLRVHTSMRAALATMVPPAAIHVRIALGMRSW